MEPYSTLDILKILDLLLHVINDDYRHESFFAPGPIIIAPFRNEPILKMGHYAHGDLQAVSHGAVANGVSRVV